MSSSEVFAPLAYTQRFWASRFAPGFEADFVFEALTPAYRHNVNWKELYCRVYQGQIPPSLLNRKRIWELLRPLSDNLKRFSTLGVHGRKPRILFDVGSDLHEFSSVCHRHGHRVTNRFAVPKGSEWIRVGAQFSHLDLTDDLNFGCRSFHKRVTILPPVVKSLHVSFVVFGGVQYISGIRFSILGRDRGVSLGYVILN